MNDLDDQVIYDLDSKLRFDTNEDEDSNSYCCPQGIEDEDIIMKDYTEEEFIIHKKEEIIEEKKVSIEPQIEDNIQHVIHQQESKTERSIIPRIFRPEDEGYYLGKVNALQTEDDNELVQSYKGMIGDTPIIIHNHHYHMNNAIENIDDINTKVVNKNLVIIKGFKNILNYSIILSVLYLIVTQIWKDIRNEYREFEINKDIIKKQCMIEYTNNKCDSFGQLPALKEECLNWLICINEGNSGYLRNLKISELGVSIIGKLINELLNKISGLNKIFILSVLIIWYSGNFAYGYMKGMATVEEKNKVD